MVKEQLQKPTASELEILHVLWSAAIDGTRVHDALSERRTWVHHRAELLQS